MTDSESERKEDWWALTKAALLITTMFVVLALLSYLAGH